MSKEYTEEERNIEFPQKTADSSNIMRQQYRDLSYQEQLAVKRFKDLGSEFIYFCDDIGTSRELSLAKTKMKEAVMWAVKSVTK